jgi:hypothetical protein
VNFLRGVEATGRKVGSDTGHHRGTIEVKAAVVRPKFLSYDPRRTVQMLRRRALIDHALVPGCLHIVAAANGTQPNRHEIRSGENWARLAERGFDPPQRFAAYLNALRWNCVTSTDPRPLQAPFRAGIRLCRRSSENVVF